MKLFWIWNWQKLETVNLPFWLWILELMIMAKILSNLVRIQTDFCYNCQWKSSSVLYRSYKRPHCLHFLGTLYTINQHLRIQNRREAQFHNSQNKIWIWHFFKNIFKPISILSTRIIDEIKNGFIQWQSIYKSTPLQNLNLAEIRFNAKLPVLPGFNLIDPLYSQN